MPTPEELREEADASESKTEELREAADKQEEADEASEEAHRDE
jgi:hypothetical protein